MMMMMVVSVCVLGEGGGEGPACVKGVTTEALRGGGGVGGCRRSRDSSPPN